MSKLMIYETAAYTEVDDGEWPETLEDMITWLMGARKNIPEQYRDKADLEIDEGPTSIRVSYRRLETDEEEADREKIHAECAANMLEFERKKYEAMKAKFMEGKL